MIWYDAIKISYTNTINQKTFYLVKTILPIYQTLVKSSKSKYASFTEFYQ